MTQDAMRYIVFVADQFGSYMPERELADMDRKTTLELVAHGEWEGLSQVIEFNPAEFSSRDVTEDFAKEVADIWADQGEPLSDFQREFVEAHLGVSFANHFQMAAE